MSEILYPVEFLLVEDEQADIDLLVEACKKLKIMNNLNVVRNGLELLKYLRKEDQYKEMVSPDFILLDLNMPKMSGREALIEIRKDESLKHIPIMILSSSDKEEDILFSYKFHANCYIQKPMRMADFEKIVSWIEEFWFSVVKLPPRIF
jgi:chemotaxis family two-component system response regulator Rcp1